jgi:hypothetical protein
MKSIAFAMGVCVTAVAATAFAQPYYRDSPNSPGSGYECWNPGAGHFEAVREGERQNDLDFSRCHRIGERARYSRDRREQGYECWNPRARHFEAVREGERQDDLDFSRCRPRE